MCNLKFTINIDVNKFNNINFATLYSKVFYTINYIYI